MVEMLTGNELRWWCCWLLVALVSLLLLLLLVMLEKKEVGVKEAVRRIIKPMATGVGLPVSLFFIFFILSYVFKTSLLTFHIVFFG